MHALFRYYYLTNEQVCRLLYSPGSLTFVRTRMKRLADAEYAQRFFVPPRNNTGRGQAVYTLARKGLAYLQSLDEELQRRYRPSEVEGLSYQFIEHTLAVNDVLIGLELLARSTDQVVIRTVLHERDLKRAPLTVTLRESEHTSTVAVIPDAYVQLELVAADGRYETCLALELDRGTEKQHRWRRKVAALLAATTGPYQERFGTNVLTVAVVTTAATKATADKRLADLLTWTEAELNARGLAHQADLFWFTALTPEPIAPAALFLTPRWVLPLSREPAILLDAIQ